MLDIRWLRTHREEAIDRLSRRFAERAPAEALIDQLLSLDDRRRHLQQEVDALRAQQNTLSRRVGELRRAGESQQAEALLAELQQLKTRLREKEKALEAIQAEWRETLATIPNCPHESVPPGTDESANQVLETWGAIPEPPVRLPHWEIAQKHGLIHFRWGAKLAGSGFYVLTGWGARLQRALIQFFLDEAARAGYVEVSPPHLVNAATGFGTGQLPDKDRQMYYIEEDELYLIPTAEVPVTNLFRECVLQEEDLPIRMVSYTPCYRREAGSWGQMTRGLNRVHQFDKVEIVHIVHPDESYTELERMCTYVHGLLEKLELPHRRVLLGGGELGFASAKTYDMEVYAAGQDRWLEVSSISNFEAFQARRMNLRVRTGKHYYHPHTLNGSALALARLMAALIENNYTPEGIRLPEVLHPYVGQEILPFEIPLPAWTQN